MNKKIQIKKISDLLRTDALGRKIICLDSVGSTNTELQKMAGADLPEGTVLLSEQQTGGRGRLGREFFSPQAKGIWMSVLLKPDFAPEQAPPLTLSAAAAVWLALAAVDAGLKEKIRIKWPNDILYGEKKLGGILTEMQAGDNHIHCVIIGIGLNTALETEDFPPDLRNEATSLLLETGKIYAREPIIAGILNNLENLYRDYSQSGNLSQSLAICREHSAVIGRKALIGSSGAEQEIEVLGLGDRGELLAKLADGRNTVYVSGEVSLRTK